MNIIIDIGHPAHVHLYKHFIQEMTGKGNGLFVTVKHIPDALELLDIYQIPYIHLGTKSDSLKGKLLNQFRYDWLIYRLVRKNRIQFGVGSSISIAHISKLTGMTSFIFDDDDSAVEPLFVKFGHPFSDYVVTPECLAHENYGEKHITYPGFHELAYLHSNRFQPDPGVLDDLDLSEENSFFVLRFNSFKAHHDIGARGISGKDKKMLVDLLRHHGRVLITCEGEIDPEFSEHRVGLSPEKIHSLLYYAKMFISDSQTMTSEAAVLGTPAIRCNSFVGRISYLEEQEHRYGLTYGFTPDRGEQMLQKVKSLLGKPDLKDEWQRRRQKMLSDKIDVTAFMVWFVENYPDSVKIMKETPDYQLRFK
jgi:predicted glycosyltransferase